MSSSFPTRAGQDLSQSFSRPIERIHAFSQQYTSGSRTCSRDRHARGPMRGWRVVFENFPVLASNAEAASDKLQLSYDTKSCKYNRMERIMRPSMRFLQSKLSVQAAESLQRYYQFPRRAVTRFMLPLVSAAVDAESGLKATSPKLESHRKQPKVGDEGNDQLRTIFTICQLFSALIFRKRMQCLS